MRYEQAKHLKPAEFKRFWGVKLETFEKMVEIVTLHSQQKKKTGRPGKVSLEFHANSQVPQKKPRKGTLSDEAKKRNRELARQRVIGEHVHRKLKIFKILADRYRNRRKRFGLRFNLIGGLYNYELRLTPVRINNPYE